MDESFTGGNVSWKMLDLSLVTNSLPHCPSLKNRETLEPYGNKLTDHKFLITTFTTPIICLHCSKFLKGLIHQGYRCKVCEISVHRGCISSTGRCKQGPVSLPPPVCDRQLSEFYWFVGPMDRDTASIRLENRKIGTYLLRVRPQGASSSTETMYALSLK